MDPIETGFASPLTLDFCRRRTHCTDEFIYDPASRGCGAVRSSPAGARAGWLPQALLPAVAGNDIVKGVWLN
jgi:hypothetical protein